MKTIKDLAQEAINVQDACNLSGVVHGFSRAITDLRAHLEQEPGFSTDKLNTHPICILWSDKIASLTGSTSDAIFGQAYRTCQDLCQDLSNY